MSVPASPEAEQALISSLLLEPRAIPVVASELTVDDFYVSRYGQIFQAMTNLSREGRSVDVVSIHQAIGGPPIDVFELTAGHRAEPDEYVSIIKRKALGRQVIEQMERVIASAMDDDEDVVQTLQASVTDILRGSDPGNLVSAHDAVGEYHAMLGERMAGKDDHMSWGVPGMDEHVNAPSAGRMVILASRPGVGKTAMAETIVDHWARSGKGPVVFASLEMDRMELLDRSVARHSEVRAKSILDGNLTADQMVKVNDALDQIKDLPIEYLDDARTTTDSLRAKLARVKLQYGGLAGVAVDYVQLMADKGDDNPVYRVTRISRQLKALAREFRVPVLVMSQLSRNIEARDADSPMLSDLRESGALEQDADTAIFLTGPRGSGMRTVHVLKQRQGETGKFKVRFDGDTVSWHEQGPWSPAWDEPYGPAKPAVDEEDPAW